MFERCCSAEYVGTRLDYHFPRGTFFGWSMASSLSRAQKGDIHLLFTCLFPWGLSFFFSDHFVLQSIEEEPKIKNCGHWKETGSKKDTPINSHPPACGVFSFARNGPNWKWRPLISSSFSRQFLFFKTKTFNWILEHFVLLPMLVIR